jgi:hypothetical protein
MNRRPLDTAVTILFGVACLAIAVAAFAYLAHLSPAAQKSDVAKVAAAMSSVSAEEAKDAKTAATQAEKHGTKLKSTEERLDRDEKEIDLLKKRVGLLDGSALVGTPGKHAPRK